MEILIYTQYLGQIYYRSDSHKKFPICSVSSGMTTKESKTTTIVVDHEEIVEDAVKAALQVSSVQGKD